jgi:hypothetical protein
MVLVGSLQLSSGVVRQPTYKGFGRRLQDHRLVERELASMACSQENNVSLCGICGLRVTTPLQRRHTSHKK